MVSRREDDAGLWRADGGAGVADGVEVIKVAVHELRPGRHDGLEVLPVDVHELPGQLRLVRGAQALPAVVVRTSALRLVPPPEAAPTPAAPETSDAPEAAEAPQADEAIGADETPEAAEAPGDRSLVVAPPLVPAEAVAPSGPVTASPPPASTASALLDRSGAPERRRGRVAPWLRRRLWVVVLCVLAGVGGGYGATKGHRGGYSAQVLLEVRSGTTPANPGGAQEAGALAVTYAALVPNDTALLNEVATRMHVTAGSLGGAVSATAETGTGLFLVTFAGPSAARAIRGANDVGAVLSSAAPPGPAIIQRSIAVVRPATTAKAGKDLRLYGLVGGMVGGGLLGLVLLLVLERVDARVDDPGDAADTCGCPATRWPGDMSARELAVALARSAPEAPISIVPLSSQVRGATERLAALLSASWPETGAATPAPVVAPYDESPAALSEGGGPAVVVVGSGEKVRSLAATCARLRLLDRPVSFAVVCERSAGQR